jgi:hypothetical protein
MTTGTQSGNSKSLWYILVLCLIAAFLTYWWFEERITEIDEKMETMQNK